MSKIDHKHNLFVNISSVKNLTYYAGSSKKEIEWRSWTSQETTYAVVARSEPVTLSAQVVVLLW